MRARQSIEWTAIVATVFLLCFTIGILLSEPTHAQSDKPMECIAAGQAGPQVLYRCEDYDTGVICYVNQFGMMFCVE